MLLLLPELCGLGRAPPPLLPSAAKPRPAPDLARFIASKPTPLELTPLPYVCLTELGRLGAQAQQILGGGDSPGRVAGADDAPAVGRAHHPRRAPGHAAEQPPPAQDLLRLRTRTQLGEASGVAVWVPAAYGLSR